MKKIFTLGILCLMLSVTMVSSAKYSFDYEKPAGSFAYPLFEFTRQNPGSMCSTIGYGLLSERGFLFNKLLSCEVELQKQYKRSCGGGGTRTVVIDNTPDFSNGDMNGDGVIDLTDLGIAGDLIETIKKNYKK